MTTPPSPAQAIDAPADPGYSSTPNNNPYMGIFYLVFLVVGVFYILNLFVAVVIDKFNQMKDKAEGMSVFLTRESAVRLTDFLYVEW